MLSAGQARRLREKEQAAKEAAEKATFERYSRVIAERLPEYVNQIMEELPARIERCAELSRITIFARDRFFEQAFSGGADIPLGERERLLPMDKARKIPGLDPFRTLRKRGYELEAYRSSSSGDLSEDERDWYIELLW